MRSVIIPPSVEFLDESFASSSFVDPHFCVREDCLLSANGRELISYSGLANTFRVSRSISFLSRITFSGNSTLEVVLFESESQIMRFPDSLFSHCARLRFVEIPKSVTAICDLCFDECRELCEIVFEFPSSVGRIGWLAFSECAKLSSFIAPSSVSTLGRAVFSDCSGLTSFAFEAPSNLSDISDSLFSDCIHLTSLTLPDSVTTIAASAFSGSGVSFVRGANCELCESLLIRLGRVLCILEMASSIRIPGSVLEIQARAFERQISLRELSFEEGIQRIGDFAFSHCKCLDNVTFPTSLTVIAAYSFFDCGCLGHITFASGSQLRCIEDSAFSNTPLKSLVLPVSVTDVKPSAFSDRLWPSFKFDGSPLFLITKHFVFSPDSTRLLRYLYGADRVVIPAHIEEIGPNVFEN
jgi:hypothetical protein